jgi:hypothetical protein
MKCILWGYPLHSDTYSYIYEAFKKAFEYLGHEVFWFTDEDYPEDFDYDDCIFFCEGYKDKNIPLRKTSTYICHVCINPEKYIGNVKKLVDMRYHVDYIEDVNYTYTLDYDNCEQLESGVLYDKNSSEYDIIYMSWAANLLPHEFDLNWATIEREPVYYMIGSISDSGPFANGPIIQEWMNYCNQSGISCYYSNPWTNPLPDEIYRQYMQKSIMQPDLRNEIHKKWGVKSCRLFKSISYGMLGMTNSPKLAKFIDDSIVCHENIFELYNDGILNYKNIDLIQHQMAVVRDKHTYINRLQGILKII